MKKVLIMGCVGAGKFRFSQQFGDITGIKVYHIDTFFCHPGYISIPNEQWDAFINEIVEKKEWIIEGNYIRTLDIRIEQADTVIFFDMPRIYCLLKLINSKVIKRKNRSYFEIEFYKWVWNYNKKVRPQVLNKLKKCANEKEIIILRKSSQVKEYKNYIKTIHNDHIIKSEI